MKTIQVNLDNEPVYSTHCKWCGRGFDKTGKPNHTLYCSTYCKREARKYQKLMYQRNRRRLIRAGVLVVSDREKPPLGTSLFSAHRHEDFNREHRALLNEKKRLGLK